MARKSRKTAKPRSAQKSPAELSVKVAPPSQSFVALDETCILDSQDGASFLTDHGAHKLRFVASKGLVEINKTGIVLRDGAEITAQFDPQKVSYLKVLLDFSPEPQSEMAYPLILAMSPDARMQICINEKMLAANGPAGSRSTLNYDGEERQRITAAFDFCGDWLDGGAAVALSGNADGEVDLSTKNSETHLEPVKISEITIGRGCDLTLHRVAVHIMETRPNADFMTGSYK